MNIKKATKENGNLPIFSVRQRALSWWNDLLLTERVVEMNKYGIEAYRSSSSLTGREIQAIYESMHVA